MGAAKCEQSVCRLFYTYIYDIVFFGIDMKLRIEQLVSLKEANQNFSRVARKVDEEGYVLLLRNNKPAYLVFAYDEDDIVADDSSLLDALHRLIERKKSAKLKKKGRGGEDNG